MRGEHWFLLLLLLATSAAGYVWTQTPETSELPAVAAASPAPDAPANKLPTRPTPPAPTGEQVGASHILIQYQGSKRSKATRTKEEAKTLAEQVMAEAKAPGADFAALAAKYSDEPGAATRRGNLGKFTRERMVKPFSDAAFALKVGEISTIVETDFGFHVIKRTE